MITELLLHAVTDVDAKAADQDYVYRTGKVWFSLDLQLCLLTGGWGWGVGVGWGWGGGWGVGVGRGRVTKKRVTCRL